MPNLMFLCQSDTIQFVFEQIKQVKYTASKLVCLSKLMLILGKTNLKSISNNLAKSAINWHNIGQMPLLHKNIKFGITWSFLSNSDILFF